MLSCRLLRSRHHSSAVEQASHMQPEMNAKAKHTGRSKHRRKVYLILAEGGQSPLARFLPRSMVLLVGAMASEVAPLLRWTRAGPTHPQKCGAKTSQVTLQSWHNTLSLAAFGCFSGSDFLFWPASLTSHRARSREEQDERGRHNGLKAALHPLLRRPNQHLFRSCCKTWFRASCAHGVVCRR